MYIQHNLRWNMKNSGKAIESFMGYDHLYRTSQDNLQADVFRVPMIIYEDGSIALLWFRLKKKI